MGVLSAASTSAATVYLSRRNHLASAPRERKSFIALPHKFRIRSESEGGGVSDTFTSEETASLETENNPVVEASQGPPSLISALNVERALRGIPITDIDYYGRLGLQRSCSYDQVYVAYKKKVEELMNEGIDDEELLNTKLELLKESYSVLSTAEERRLYDWSLVRSEKTDRYAWPFEADTMRKTTDTPPPQEPEDVGPTRAVGYFMLGWLLLAFTLSIALSR